MNEASRNHRKIASNIRELVVNPFAKWCEQHAGRVQASQDDLQGRIRGHDRQADTVRSYRSAYFNKCRRVEDVDEEEKLAFQDPSSAAASTGSPKPGPQSVPSINVNEAEDEPELEMAQIQEMQKKASKRVCCYNHFIQPTSL